MTSLNRRNLILGAGSALSITALGSLPAQAATASREFKAYLGSRHVGGQIVTVSRQGADITVKLETELRAKILLMSYKYKLNSVEIWRNGVLRSIRSTTRENDRKDFVNARRVSGGLSVDASRFSGVVAGNPASSSFFVPELATRDVWVSTQSGKPMNVATQRAGTQTFVTDAGSVACTRYKCGGDLKYPLEVFYTADNELAGYVARARGFKIRSVAQSLDQKLASVWG